MEKKKVVVALGHKALGTTLPEQQVAVKNAAKAIADLVEEGCQVAISHSNAPQVGMIHTALNEFGKEHENYTFAPMSVCSAMSSDCSLMFAGSLFSLLSTSRSVSSWRAMSNGERLRRCRFAPMSARSSARESS